MKKELLIFGSLLCLMSGIGAVRAQTCATPPSCASLGYTMTSSDCSGQPTLVCPFDASAVFCAGTASSGGAGGSTGGGAGSGLIESCNGDCFVVITDDDVGYKYIYKAKLIDGVSDGYTCDSVCEQNGVELLYLNYKEASGLINLCIGTNKTSGKYYYYGVSTSGGWRYNLLDCSNRSIVSYSSQSDATSRVTGCLCARVIG